MSGLVLAAVLAAICSTADSQLVVAASAGANDLYARQQRRPKPRKPRRQIGEHAREIALVERYLRAGLELVPVLQMIPLLRRRP